MRALFLFVIFFLQTVQAAPLLFKQGGKEVAKLTKVLSKEIGAKKIKVWEPHEEKEVVYIGYPVKKVFDAVFGEKWIETEEVLFTCLDGYQPSIPTHRFRRYDAFLAFKREGQEFQVIDNHKDKKVISLGPYYLIWDNLTKKHLQVTNGWPYQVVSLDLIRFEEKFPRLSPPKNSNAQVLDGFKHYRIHCMSCHKMNGEGGEIAAELNYPMNITEYFDLKIMEKWISDPRSVRANSQMPALAKRIPNREKVIKNIIAYIASMKASKFAPAVDTKPEVEPKVETTSDIEAPIDEVGTSPSGESAASPKAESAPPPVEKP